MSGSDAVDGSSTRGTRVPSKWALLRHPMIRRSQGYASDHHCRSRYREVSFPGSWCRCGWQGSCPPSAQAALCSDVLSEAATVPGWHRSVCVVALLVTRTSGARSHCTPDAAGLCQAIRDVNGWEERTARNAEPVDPAIRTIHSGHRMVECVL